MKRAIRIVWCSFCSLLCFLSLRLDGARISASVEAAFTPDMCGMPIDLKQIGAQRETLTSAPPMALSCRMEVRAAQRMAHEVLVFHGVADNRYGMTEPRRDS